MYKLLLTGFTVFSCMAGVFELPSANAQIYRNPYQRPLGLGQYRFNGTVWEFVPNTPPPRPIIIVNPPNPYVVPQVPYGYYNRTYRNPYRTYVPPVQIINPVPQQVQPQQAPVEKGVFTVHYRKNKKDRWVQAGSFNNTQTASREAARLRNRGFMTEIRRQ